MNDSIKPRARQNELITQEMPDELLVYDLAAHKAYCLNRTAAIIWNLCDGDSTITDLATRSAAAANAAISEEAVWLALDELEKFGLLQVPAARADAKRISRRELTRRLGFAAAASLPLIIALTAPTAAQSASLKSNGTACTLGDECASGCCDPGLSVCTIIEVCNTAPRRNSTISVPLEKKSPKQR